MGLLSLETSNVADKIWRWWAALWPALCLVIRACKPARLQSERRRRTMPFPLTSVPRDTRRGIHGATQAEGPSRL